MTSSGAYAGGEDWLYVYLLLDFQSIIDAWMAVRIQTYLGLLYQDLIRAEQLSAHGRLPPVLPIVLYNGKSPPKTPFSKKPHTMQEIRSVLGHYMLRFVAGF